MTKTRTEITLNGPFIINESGYYSVNNSLYYDK